MIKHTLALSVFLLAAPALAQPSGAPAPETAPVLAGPKVSPASSKPTLVERGFDGKVKRLDIPPAEAAVKLVDLDDATRRRVDDILLERAIALDKIVRENLLTIVNLSNAFKAGNKADAQALLKELADKSEALRARGKLMEEFADVLPAAKLAEAKGLVQEYWQAVVQEVRDGGDREMDATAKETGDAGKPDRPAAQDRAPGAILRAEGLAVIGREIKRSYERVVTAGVKELDEFIKRLDLAPEQEAQVRRLTQDYFQKTAGKPTQAQRTELFLQVYTLLNDDQRKELLKSVELKRAK